MTGEDRPTVLVVDDEPNVAEAYSLWLSEDYEVREAHDGEEALEALDDSVDVVLLDRRMPNLTGDEVLERIRARDYRCRVAMVTAVDPDFDVLDMAFDTYLTKPVTGDDLQETVERLLAVAEYDERLREHFRLAEKRAVIESQKSDTELEDSEEYAELASRMAEIEAEIDETLERMDDEQFAATFRDLSLDDDR